MNSYTKKLARSLSEGDQDAAAELGRILTREGHLPNTYVLVHYWPFDERGRAGSGPYHLLVEIESWMPGVEDLCDRLRQYREFKDSGPTEIRAIFEGSLVLGETSTLGSLFSPCYFCDEKSLPEEVWFELEHWDPNQRFSLKSERITLWRPYLYHILEDFEGRVSDWEEGFQENWTHRNFILSYQSFKEFLENE